MINEKLVRFTVTLVVTQLLALLAFGQREPPPAASLRFLVVDTFGLRIDDFEVSLENTVGSEFRAENPLGRYAKKYDGNAYVPLVAPCGVYKLTVVARGFKPWSMRLRVDQPQMWIPIGLSLGSLTPNSSDASLVVNVSGAGASEQAWIKASELYSDVSKSARCDRRGTCRITNLRPGLYMIFLFNGGKLLSSQTVSLRAMENELNLSWPTDSK